MLHDLFIDFTEIEAHDRGTVINVDGFVILVCQLYLYHINVVVQNVSLL